jgi:hypothetical protein
MSGSHEIAIPVTINPALLALMEAPNQCRKRQEGRVLRFHGRAWGTLGSTAVAALLETPTQRPHISVEDVARLLGGGDSSL